MPRLWASDMGKQRGELHAIVEKPAFVSAYASADACGILGSAEVRAAASPDLNFGSSPNPVTCDLVYRGSRGDLAAPDVDELYSRDDV